MLKDSQLPMLGAGIVLLIVVALLFHSAVSGQLFSDQGFHPHGECIAWDPGLLEVYATSDTLIGLSYIVISLMLGLLVFRARRQLPFDWILIAFGGFIFFCGLTHFMDVVTLWQPLYWIDGGTKVLTALASVATALALPPTLPKVMALIARAKQAREQRLQLAAINWALEDEITERKRVEKDLRGSLDREQRLKHFHRQIVTDLSHVFRTPMAVIQTASYMLQTYFDRLTPEQRTDRLDRIQGEIDHLTRLLDDMLMIDRLEAGQGEFRPQPTDLADLCRSVIMEMQPSAGDTLQLEFQGDSDCAEYLIDSSLIHHALQKLLENAISYSPEGGRIRLELHCAPGSATISISDEGIGVPESDRASIFDTFYRGENAQTLSGTGLGLAIAKQAVERHGGSITLADQPPPGSRFVITLTEPPHS